MKIIHNLVLAMVKLIISFANERTNNELANVVHDVGAALEDDFTFVLRSDIKKAAELSIEASCETMLADNSDGNDEVKTITQDMPLHRCGFIL